LGLVVGDAGTFELHPIKTMGMVNIAKIKSVTFLFIISPQQLGINFHAPVFSCK
jgi:hypothetical protein